MTRCNCCFKVEKGCDGLCSDCEKALRPKNVNYKPLPHSRTVRIVHNNIYYSSFNQNGRLYCRKLRTYNDYSNNFEG
jgi:hypothetical protein